MVPLGLNSLFAAGTALVLLWFYREKFPLAALVSVFAFNVPGLVLTGMEHSLQVLLAAASAYWLSAFAETGKRSPWLIPVLVLAPLVRYECLAISLPAMAFLFCSGEKRASSAGFALLVLFIGGFSLFLCRLNLSPLPASVFAKSSVVSGSGTASSLFANLRNSLGSFRGIAQAFVLLPLAAAVFSGRPDRRRRMLALAAITSVLLHLLVGRFGWFHRYGVYMWVFSVMICHSIYRVWLGRHRMLFALVLLAAGSSYVSGYAKTVHASSNIYRQQYQMRRFIHSWLDGPVAVNDLGLVSLGYSHYVLDMWGLATPEALTGAQDPLWVDSAAMARGVNFALVYQGRLAGMEHWTRVARMELHPPLVVCPEQGVDFLAAPWASADTLRAMAESFAKTLPDGIDFIVYDHGLSR
jgi:hypothetical protein